MNGGFARGGDHFDHFHGDRFRGHVFIGVPFGYAFYPPYADYSYFDSYCNPGSPYYDPRACWDYYDD